MTHANIAGVKKTAAEKQKYEFLSKCWINKLRPVVQAFRKRLSPVSRVSHVRSVVLYYVPLKIDSVTSTRSTDDMQM